VHKYREGKVKETPSGVKSPWNRVRTDTRSRLVTRYLLHNGPVTSGGEQAERISGKRS